MKHYFSFEGRASRKEWWALQAGCILLGFAIIFPTVLAEVSYAKKLSMNAPEKEVSWPDPAFSDFLPVTSAVMKLFFAAYFWIFVASSVRRLHDMDRSGWWWWIFLVPGIGQFVFTIWVGFFPPIPGENVPNRYG
jgi:uncharacterized membrane protein YhaH (DUF805 family)